MKEKTKKKIRGSISILLVIILVPMLCLSGLIVDNARVELAQASVSSAGDLTMNAALANYDTVLKDVYGLFAMSQTSEDLSENLYDYFADTLLANGIIASEDEIQSNPLLQDISTAFSGITFESVNLLEMEVDKEDFAVEKVADSSLANPYILKNQIIEYEKYRAPVGTALSLVDGVAALKKIFDQSSVNKAKTKVDEKAGELNKSSNTLYDTLKKYDPTKSDEFESTYKYYGQFTSKGLDYTYSDAYKNTIIPVYVRKAAESMPFGRYIERKEDGSYSFSYAIQEIENTIGKGGAEWLTGSFNSASKETLLEEIEYAYMFFTEGTLQEYTDLLGLAGNIEDLDLEDKRIFSMAYEIYMQKVFNLKNFYDAFMENYGLEEEDKTEDTDNSDDKSNSTDVSDDSDGSENSDGSDSVDSADGEKEDKNFVQEHNGDILNIFENAVSYSNKLKTYEDFVTPMYANADTLIYDLNQDIIGKIAWFTDVEGILQTAIEQIGTVNTNITNLDTANGELNTQIKKYDGDDASDGFSKQMQSEHDYYEENLSSEKVTSLKNELVRIKTYFSNIKTYLQGISFSGLAAHSKDNNALNNLITMVGSNITSTGETNTEYINSHIADNLDGLKNYFLTLYVEGEYPGYQQVSIENNEFYKYLQQAYSVKPEADDGDAETQESNMKKLASGSQDATKSEPQKYNQVTVSDEIKALLPSQGSYLPPAGVTGYDGKESFSSLFDRITTAVANLLQGAAKALTAGRDNLYVTNYVFDMFTHNLMEMEYKADEGKAESERSKSLEELDLEPMTTSSGIEKNAQNNYMYGSEVEYILYGGFDAKSNVQSAKTNIFCIRFLANASYALTNSEIKSITLPPALSLQAATMGVVPYKLTQVVLQLCLALGESANDIAMMEKGEKVVLIKTSDTWLLSPKGMIDKAKDAAMDATQKVVNEAAKKAKGVVNDLIDAGAEKVRIKVDDYLDDMTIAINGQIETIIGNIFSEFEAEIIESLDGYLKQGQSAVSDAGAVAESIVNSADSKAQEIINSADDSIKPILSGFYSDHLKTKLNTFKTEIQNALADINSLDAGALLLKVQKSIASELELALRDMHAYVEMQSETLINSLSDQLKDYVSDGCIDAAADDILEMTNAFIGNTFDSLADKMPEMKIKSGNSSVLSSILQFNYGDYLKIFIFLNLCMDDNEILSRVADVIQFNVNDGLKSTDYKHPILKVTLADGSTKKFLMSDAYTYVQISADVRLKTMFMAQPFFTEYAEDSGSYFAVNYKSVLGY